MKKRTLANVLISTGGGIAIAGAIAYQNADKINAIRLEHKIEKELVGIGDVDVTGCNKNGFHYIVELKMLKVEVNYTQEKNLLVVEETHKHNSSKNTYFDFGNDGVLDGAVLNNFAPDSDWEMHMKKNVYAGNKKWDYTFTFIDKKGTLQAVVESKEKEFVAFRVLENGDLLKIEEPPTSSIKSYILLSEEHYALSNSFTNLTGAYSFWKGLYKK